MIKSYSELLFLETLEERYEYLRIGGTVGKETFGFERYLNQRLYTSDIWRSLRDQIIIRDNACDLGVEDYEIKGRIIIHHINPITVEDIEFGRDIVFDPENLICVSHNTHLAIHYGNESLLPELPVERRPFDTCPWK